MAIVDEKLGLVIARFGEQAQIETSEGERVTCYMRRTIVPPVAGDRVQWEYSDKETGIITGLEPRDSLLSRPTPRGLLKPIAANVSAILITLAFEPKPQLLLLDEYLVACRFLQIPTCIVINKIDLVALDTDPFVEKIKAIYTPLRIDLFFCSIKEDQTLNALTDFMANKTTVLVGQSGVGKSSLIKKLIPEAEIGVGALSDSLAGKHTTTLSRLYHLPTGGDLIDSPGVRNFALEHVDAQTITQGFPEILQAASHCYFRNCKHHSEPNCAVQTALASGEITSSRWKNYQTILTNGDKKK